MEKRILLEKRGRNPSEIKELNLDNCCSSSIVGFTDEFENLETLSMIKVGLTNLKGFPKLPNLKKLELSDNRISGGLNILSSNCPKLKSLHLGGNKIDDVEILEPLKELKSLEHLELTNCDIASLENYREKIFKLLPNLKYLDGFDQNDREIDESETENGKTDSTDDNDGIESEIESDVSEEDSDVEDSEEEEEIGLKALQDDIIDEESEGDDYNPDGENSEDEDIEDDSDHDDGATASKEKSPRGEKRKLESDD